MREPPTKFWKSKNLITKKGYPTNQNLENNKLNPPYKKSILEDSYINHDILSSPSQFSSTLATSSTLNLLSQLLLISTSISKSQEIICQLYNYKFHTVRGPTIIKQ